MMVLRRAGVSWDDTLGHRRWLAGLEPRKAAETGGRCEMQTTVATGTQHCGSCVRFRNTTFRLW